MINWEGLKQREDMDSWVAERLATAERWVHTEECFPRTEGQIIRENVPRIKLTEEQRNTLVEAGKIELHEGP